MSPFYANYGREVPFGIINRPESSNQASMDFGKTMEDIWKRAQDTLDKTSATMKKRFDEGRKKPVYEVGDQVLLEGRNIKTKRPSEKLSDKRYGPFEILEKVGEGAWKLKIPPGWSIHPVFHESLLTPYHGPERHTRPLPDLVEGGEEYEVEKILDSRKRRGKPKEWLVKWKGYPLEEADWEPKENLKNAMDLVKKYEKGC